MRRHQATDWGAEWKPVLWVVAIFMGAYWISKFLGYDQKHHWKIIHLRGLRMAVLGGLGLLGASLFLAFYPDFMGGPFAMVNPKIKPIWLDLVMEVQPLWGVSSSAIGKMILYLGLPILSLIYLLFVVGYKPAEGQGHRREVVREAASLHQGVLSDPPVRP